MTDLYEEAEGLLEGVRKALSSFTDEVLTRDDSNQLEKEHVLDVAVDLGALPLGIEFVITDGVPDQYRYNVRVRNRETGEKLGRGNGGPTWAAAFSNYQWQSVVRG